MKGVSNFVNGYIGKSVANFINGFFVIRSF